MPVRSGWAAAAWRRQRMNSTSAKRRIVENEEWSRSARLRSGVASIHPASRPACGGRLDHAWDTTVAPEGPRAPGHCVGLDRPFRRVDVAYDQSRLRLAPHIVTSYAQSRLRCARSQYWREDILWFGARGGEPDYSSSGQTLA